MTGLENIDLTSIVLESFMATIEPLKPYFAEAVAGLIVFGLVKWLWHKLHDFLYIEESAKERRKAHKKIDSAVDFISNTSDLLSSLKSNSEHK